MREAKALQLFALDEIDRAQLSCIGRMQDEHSQLRELRPALDGEDGTIQEERLKVAWQYELTQSRADIIHIVIQPATERVQVCLLDVRSRTSADGQMLELTEGRQV